MKIVCITKLIKNVQINLFHQQQNKNLYFKVQSCVGHTYSLLLLGIIYAN